MSGPSRTNRPGPRRPGPRTSRSRPQASREPRPTILIVCEGQETEPNYFRAFKVTNDVYGEGRNTRDLVDDAKCRNDAQGAFDQVWCVFDRDEFPNDNFDNAIARARSNGFHIAYSNPCFELWYLLHFQNLDAALDRHQICQKLSVALETKYEKSHIGMYALLAKQGDEGLALRYARSLREQNDPAHPPSRRCPETTVDKLVEVLRAEQTKR